MFPGKPDPVRNCSTNVSTSSFTIACVPGFNGGLPQNFTIQVMEHEGLEGTLVTTLDNTDPVFTVTNLKDSTDYWVYVTPFNMKGNGQPQNRNGQIIRTETAAKPLVEQPPNGNDFNFRNNNSRQLKGGKLKKNSGCKY